jgi:predicted DNA-binding protein (UPF0251 family)
MGRRRLTDAEVREVLRLHVRKKMTAPDIAARMGVSSNAIYQILWGLTHTDITKGRNVSQARKRVADRVDLMRSVYAETGNKTAAARAAGVTWQTANHHITKGDAA